MPHMVEVQLAARIGSRLSRAAGRALPSASRAVFGAERDCAVITQATKLLLPFLVVGNLAATS